MHSAPNMYSSSRLKSTTYTASHYSQTTFIKILDDHSFFLFGCSEPLPPLGKYSPSLTTSYYAFIGRHLSLIPHTVLVVQCTNQPVSLHIKISSQITDFNPPFIISYDMFFFLLQQINISIYQSLPYTIPSLARSNFYI